MMQWLAIAGGGAVGAVFRFALSNATYSWLGRGFPYGTLVVNVLGSLLMGIGFVLAVSPERAEEVLQAAEASGDRAYRIGTVSGKAGVQFVGEQDGTLDGQ